MWDASAVLDGPVDVQVLVDASPRKIKLYGTNRACVGVCPLVLLLKKGIKLLLRLLPEWGQELFCLHLVVLNLISLITI
jgi:hypothetical protein